MFIYRGKTALITGASSGIGAVFARALAARGVNLILVARSEGKLRTLAAELAQHHGIATSVIAADLSRAEAVQQVTAEVARQGLTVDMLVNNAGFATNGPFETLDPARDHEELMVNVAAVVGLSHAFLPAMAARGDGAVINVASTAGFQPVPYMAVYGATKAFVLSFSEALWGEYRRRGVRVLALAPGATATAFFEVAGEGAQVGQMETPEQVVAVGLRALERGRSFVISGLGNYLLSNILPRLLPRPIVAMVAERMLRPQPATTAASPTAQSQES